MALQAEASPDRAFSTCMCWTSRDYLNRILLRAEQQSKACKRQDQSRQKEDWEKGWSVLPLSPSALG